MSSDYDGNNNDKDDDDDDIDDNDDDGDDDDDDRDGDEYFASAGCRSSTPYLVGWLEFPPSWFSRRDQLMLISNWIFVSYL